MLGDLCVSNKEVWAAINRAESQVHFVRAFAAMVRWSQGRIYEAYDGMELFEIETEVSDE